MGRRRWKWVWVPPTPAWRMNRMIYGSVSRYDDIYQALKENA